MTRCEKDHLIIGTALLFCCVLAWLAGALS